MKNRAPTDLAAAPCAAAASFAVGAAWADAPDQFSLQRAEFAKYHRQITGMDAPKDAVRFAIDPKVSKSGKDDAKPLADMRPTLPRTQENYAKTLTAFAKAAEAFME